MLYLTSLTLAVVLSAVATADDADPLSTYPRSDALRQPCLAQAGRRKRDPHVVVPRGDPGIAMVCTADLSSDKVTTSREVYDHASQSTKTRELSHAQVMTLGELAKSLPVSAKTPELKNLLLVSVSEKGKVKTFLYDRSAPPRDIFACTTSPGRT